MSILVQTQISELSKKLCSRVQWVIVLVKMIYNCKKADFYDYNLNNKNQT